MNVWLTVTACLVLGMPMAVTDAASRDSGGAAPATADVPQPAAPSRTFTLLRVTPFSGTNPFDLRGLRSDVTAARTPGGGTPPGPGPGGSCTVGALMLIGPLPVVPPGNAFVDVNPGSGTLSVRDSGAASANTALVMALPTMDMTRFSVGPVGWQAVSPALPRDYNAGAPPQTFIVRQISSGDAYRFTISFIGTSTLAVTGASAECCGTGGCP